MHAAKRGRAPDGPADAAALSPAQAHALRRSAPLTSTEFKAHRLLVENGRLSLSVILRERDDDRAPPTRWRARGWRNAG